MKRMFSLKQKVHGTDSPLTFRWQSTLGNYLATTGQDQVVRIWDRHGQLREEIQLSGTCTGLEWDKDGDILCFICEKNNTLFMWDANLKKTTRIDSGARDSLSFLSWSKSDLTLAVGTVKGNLILYDHKIGRKVSILGKHSKRILCGCWSLSTNYLAMGGAENTVTISDVNGKTLHQFSVRDQPSNMQFSEMKKSAVTRNDGEENTVSMIVGKKTLLFYKMYDPDDHTELAFQPRYGKIEVYSWYGDGYIMIGFSNGYLVVISTHLQEIGQELFQVRNHHDYLSSVSISSTLNFAASCGDTSIRIHDLSKLEEVNAIINVDDEKGLNELGWTQDGQLLAVSTTQGSLHCYLTKLPMLGDTWGTKVAFLTSLLEVTVMNHVEEEDSVTIDIDVEPSFVACGPFHIAIGMNNRAWFYNLLGDKDMAKTRDREYLGTIQDMKLNSDYAAVMFDGKLQLHIIDASLHGNVEGREAKLFPVSDDTGEITCFALTSEFLIYGTSNGTLYFFLIEDWNDVNVYRHGTGIRDIFPNFSGGHIAFIDEKGDGVIYNPVNDFTYEIPDLPGNIKGLLWENYPFDKGVFIAYDDETIYTYIFHRESIEGPHVSYVGTTRLPFSQLPLLLHNGCLTLQSANGKSNFLYLQTHSFLADTKDDDIDFEKNFTNALALRRWKEAWEACIVLKAKENWEKLGEAAIMALDVDWAIRVYRQLGNAGMVIALENLRNTEDSHLLAGVLSSYIGRFDRAQELLLSSSKPLSALDLRRDLMQWDTALQLANRLDPQQIPFIAKEYGQQLEFTGNYQTAYQHYEKGLLKNSPEHKEHNNACLAGLARTSIRTGNIRRGVEISLKHPNRQLKKECGSILEGMKQYQESAMLYEHGEYFDKAAAVYIRSKNWAKVGQLLPQVTSTKIHLQYAKAKEADGKFTEAADAYHIAKDYDNEIRVYLDHLRDPERAVNIVKATGSTEGAKMVANFFIKLSDYGSAIQFLVLSKCNDEAFQMAQQHNQMEVYADIVGDDATSDDLKSIAVHFENVKNHFMAGKFFYRCGDYPKALKHFLKCSNPEQMDEVLNNAIQVVSAAQNPQLTRKLSDYLLGETDGVPKDAKFIFSMYMGLEKYADAAQTAVIISKQEQENANYRRAHDLLLSMMKELRGRNIKPPAAMDANLMILHSYLLVKNWVKRGDHSRAARMLIRVAENISKFPKHIVPILTSTVVECHKSGLGHSSFSYAAMLMRPEYRTQLDPKIKKKIEHIVRRSGGKTVDEEEDTSPCPFCGFDLVNSELLCPSCRNNIPYCIVTGRHVVKADLATCPSCQFPAIMSIFQTYLEYDPTCPMCSEKVQSDDLLKIKDVDGFLQAH